MVIKNRFGFRIICEAWSPLLSLFPRNELLEWILFGESGSRHILLKIDQLSCKVSKTVRVYNLNASLWAPTAIIQFRTCLQRYVAWNTSGKSHDSLFTRNPCKIVWMSHHSQCNIWSNALLLLEKTVIFWEIFIHGDTPAFAAWLYIEQDLNDLIIEFY